MPITAAEVEMFIKTGQTENATLEFKRDGYRVANKSTELLDDIVSMANAQGGTIIIGMDEDDEGRAVRLCPIAAPGEERDWIANVATTGVHPSVVGLEITPLAASTGEQLLVIQVPRSALRPHSAVKGDGHRYRVRRGRSNGWLAPAEIRDMVIAETSARTRARNLLIARQERARDTARPQVLVQVLPINTEGEPIDLRDEEVRMVIYNPPEVVKDAFYRGGHEALGRMPEQVLEGRRIRTLRAELEVWFSGYVEYRAWGGGLFFKSDGKVVAHATHLGAAVCSAIRFVDALYRRASLADECITCTGLVNVGAIRLLPHSDTFTLDQDDFDPNAEPDPVVERVATLPSESPDAVAFELLARLAWALGSNTVHGFDQRTRHWSAERIHP